MLRFNINKVFLGLIIILVFPLMQQGLAQNDNQAQEQSTNWIPPQPEPVMEEAPVKRVESEGPAKVRIGLRLTSFKKITTRNQNNSLSYRFVPMEPLRHTLRARLDRPNHFFIGEWHIETKPLTWIKKTRKYSVRLVIHKRYGAFGQLEENVGTVDLAGTLDESEDNVHVLLGVARKRLRDKFGHPVLDVVAGFTPSAKSKSVISKNEHVKGRSTIPAEPPVNYSGSLIRGRF